jgi:hypothetical protein
MIDQFGFAGGVLVSVTHGSDFSLATLPSSEIRFPEAG